MKRGPILVLAVAALAACGSSKPTARASATAAATQAATASPSAAETATASPRATAAAASSTDWPRFGYDAAGFNDAPHGISAAAVAGLHERSEPLVGTVDSSPIYLAGVRVGGGTRDVVVMTTTYGRTFALDAAGGKLLWTFTPHSYPSLAGTAQITTATPISDRRYVYAAAPDGHIYKLRLSDGHEVTSGAWPVAMTKDPTHEKLASALNLQRGKLLVVTDGYIGDVPPYQGKIVALEAGNGHITSVFNSLCSNRREIIQPSTCAGSDSAIWGRTGAVVDPSTGDVLVTTSNGPFDGKTNWGDSVLEFSAGAQTLLRHWTPADQAQLDSGDLDLGSTSPALLPDPASGRVRDAIQGGKDGKLRLLALPGSLHGVRGSAGTALGGERQVVSAPGNTDVFTAIAVLHRKGLTEAFVATNAGTAAYRFSGGALHELWSNSTPGTSPIVAGSVLWVYDPTGGLVAYRPQSGSVIHRFDAPPGHWNSPIIAGGRVYEPSGNANTHGATGTLTILSP